MSSLCRTWYRKSMYREASLRVWILLSLSDGSVGMILRNEAKASFRDCVRWRSRMLAMVRWLCGSSRVERLPGLGPGTGERDGPEEGDSWGLLLILLGPVGVKMRTSSPGSAPSGWVAVSVTVHIWSSACESIGRLCPVTLGAATTTGQALEGARPGFSTAESPLPAGCASVGCAFSLIFCPFFPRSSPISHLSEELQHFVFLPSSLCFDECLHSPSFSFSSPSFNCLQRIPLPVFLTFFSFFLSSCLLQQFATCQTTMTDWPKSFFISFSLSVHCFGKPLSSHVLLPHV